MPHASEVSLPAISSARPPFRNLTTLERVLEACVEYRRQLDDAQAQLQRQAAAFDEEKAKLKATIVGLRKKLKTNPR